jgi:hypothetical protein
MNQFQAEACFLPVFLHPLLADLSPIKFVSFVSFSEHFSEHFQTLYSQHGQMEQVSFDPR